MRARALGLVVLSLFCWPVPAAAQTRFAWPDTAVDFGRYTRVEECLAAIDRANRGRTTHEAMTTGTWRDTTPLPLQDVLAPVPASVVATAHSCSQRFSAADSVPLTDFHLLLQLYLFAGWEEQARVLVQRRLASIKPNAREELVAVLDTVINAYMGRVGLYLWDLPPRLAAIEELVGEQLPRIATRLDRFRLAWSLMNVMIRNDAIWVIDPEPLTRLGSRVVAIMDSLTPDEWARFKEEHNIIDETAEARIREAVFGIAEMLLGKQTFLDSLRRSTAAFVKLKRDTWDRATARAGLPYSWGVPIGERAPSVEGDVWLGRGDSTTPRPTPGRVSLVVFLNHQECQPTPLSMYAFCAEQLVPLRRFQDRFPALEITVVARTHGYWAYVKDSLAVAREAELTKRWLESYGLRAALVMTETEFWRLPSPDGRRVERETSNAARYSFGKSWRLYNGTAFLIDQDGIVIHSEVIRRQTEREFAELIEVLLERAVARS